MRQPDKNAGSDTRRRLLEAACEAFAGKGYRDTTVADICKRAHANIAAVNYYFGSKESLYVEAWRHAFNRSIQAYPPDGGVCEDAPPTEQLRARVLALLRRMADKKSGEFSIVRMELANPTGLLHKAMHKAIQPFREGMSGAIRMLLGPEASEKQEHFCLASVFSQCMHVMFRARLMPRGERDLLGPKRLEEFADHIVKFSLAGIHAVREDAVPPGDGSQGK